MIFPALANLISNATGDEFVYRYSGNWPVYIRNMRESRFALVFDEPHLVSWRVEHLGHVPLIKLNGRLSFVIVARDNDDAVVQLRDLAGRAVCADAPPAIDNLILFAEFDNPSRVPVLRRVRDPADAYAWLLEGRCRGAVLPTKLYNELSHDSNETRILFLSRSFPHWALSADPRLPASVRDKIQHAMLDPRNAAVAGLLTALWPGRNTLQPTVESEYRGYTDLLQDFWGLQ